MPGILFVADFILVGNFFDSHFRIQLEKTSP